MKRVIIDTCKLFRCLVAEGQTEILSLGVLYFTPVVVLIYILA